MEKHEAYKIKLRIIRRVLTLCEESFLHRVLEMEIQRRPTLHRDLLCSCITHC